MTVCFDTFVIDALASRILFVVMRSGVEEMSEMSDEHQIFRFGCCKLDRTISKHCDAYLNKLESSAFGVTRPTSPSPTADPLSSRDASKDTPSRHSFPPHSCLRSSRSS